MLETEAGWGRIRGLRRLTQIIVDCEYTLPAVSIIQPSAGTASQDQAGAAQSSQDNL
jgi:hypothetical protein